MSGPFGSERHRQKHAPTTPAGDTATGEWHDIVRWQRDYLCFWRETQSRPHANRDGLSIFRADKFPHCFRESCPAFTRAGRKNGERNPGDCGGELHFVELDPAKYLMPSELSGGMKKRVAVARSLVLDPDLILFDEPTTGLDPMVAHNVNEVIRNLNRLAAVTTLVVTHDLHTAFYLASRIAMLNQGKIVELGSPAAIRKSQNPVVVQFLRAALAESSLDPDPEV